MSGPFGYRPELARQQETRPVLNPVAEVYVEEGIDGVLRSLPIQAVNELRSRLMGQNLNLIVGLLLMGFVLLILWDVLFKRR